MQDGFFCNYCIQIELGENTSIRLLPQEQQLQRIYPCCPAFVPSFSRSLSAGSVPRTHKKGARPVPRAFSAHHRRQKLDNLFIFSHLKEFLSPGSDREDITNIRWCCVKRILSMHSSPQSGHNQLRRPQQSTLIEIP